MKATEYKIFSLYAYSIYPACFDSIMNVLMTNGSPHQALLQKYLSLRNYWKLNVNIMQYIRLAIMINNLITFTLGLRSSGCYISYVGGFYWRFLTDFRSLFQGLGRTMAKQSQLPVQLLTVGPIGCTEMLVNIVFWACAAPRYLNFWSSIALQLSFNASIKERSKCRLCEFLGCFILAEDSVLVVYVTASQDEFMQRRMSEQRNSQILG
jgi:hypothetical protein